MSARALPAHPTLRLRDVFPRHRQDLRAIHAPHALHLTHNARGAFYQLLQHLPAQKGRTVLLPAFHCTALVEPVTQAGYQVLFYRIRHDFSPDFDDIRLKMSSDVAVLVAIHYFGFPTDMQPFRQVAEMYAAYVVEDCAHSFLSRQGQQRVGHQGDFALFSYYKFAPSLAGGGLGINTADFSAPFVSETLPLRERIVLAKRLAEQILANSPKNPVSRILLALEQTRVASRKQPEAGPTSNSEFLDDPYLFRKDVALAAIPGLCQAILESCHWENMLLARQRNYRLIANLLTATESIRPIFPALPEAVCPWAFPVLVTNRAAHDYRLRALGVPLYTFGEVLHRSLSSFHDQARADAEYLSQRTMLLPVHAQLTESDVRRFVETVNQYFEKLALVANETSDQGGVRMAATKN